MKYIIFVSCFYIGLIVNAQNSLLIDDFEDSNIANLKNGYWYTFNDNSDGGKTSITPSNWQTEGFVSGGYKSNKMLKVNVNLEKANYQWDPYYGFGTGIPASTRISDYDGISYWHKGCLLYTSDAADD